MRLRLPNLATERQKAIIETIRMRLTEQQSLEYLKRLIFLVVQQHFTKKKVEQMKLNRLHHIASIGFVYQHLDRGKNIELCSKLMWKNYNKYILLKSSLC